MRLNRILASSSALALSIGCVAAAGAAAAPSAPVIHETFTLLPCPRKPATTRQLEGCAEHRVIADDKTIDALNAKAFARLSKAGRADFTAANTDWVRYRDASCQSESSIYAGGSIQPVAYANCLVSIDVSHVSELKRMRIALSVAA